MREIFARRSVRGHLETQWSVISYEYPLARVFLSSSIALGGEDDSPLTVCKGSIYQLLAS